MIWIGISIGLAIGVLIGVGVMAPLAIWLRRKTEDQTRDAVEQDVKQQELEERLEEIGTMTGGLAHEIKNPLSTIGLNLQLVKETIGDIEMEPMYKHRLGTRIDSVTQESDRLRNILEDFLRYAGRMRLAREPHDVNEMATTLVDFYQPQADASGVQLRTMMEEGKLWVAIDDSMMKQAVLNLLINGIQAMVDARYREVAHGGCEDLLLKIDQRDGQVVIHVIDTGPGISEDMVQKIFHPYFSKKKGGSGLGLAVTRRIVEEHGGKIEVESEEGKGSDFQIILPKIDPESWVDPDEE